jgi:putative ABC transport system ATP-binding protein
MVGARIAIRDLRFGYPEGAFELHVPELSVAEGARVAITGPSGCGKTTLVNLVAGICVPQSGCVTVGGETVSGMCDAARRNFRISNVGFVFQEFELVDYLCAEENILLPYLINRSLALTREVRKTARELADSVGIASMLTRSPRELSQGERQRVAICRALITKPRLLIADEPTGNLDDDNARVIMDLIAAQLDVRNTTFLVVTHDRGLLSEFDAVIDVPAMSKERGA